MRQQLLLLLVFIIIDMISIRSNIMDKLYSKPSYTNPKTGDKYWFKNNKFIEEPNRNPGDWGELHRVNGPAIEWTNGTKEWCLNGTLHRTDGPAIEYHSGRKEWWLNDKRHRTDGPAIEWANGNKEWYLNGTSLTEEEFNAIPKDQRNNYKNDNL